MAVAYRVDIHPHVFINLENGTFDAKTQTIGVMIQTQYYAFDIFEVSLTTLAVEDRDFKFERLALRCGLEKLVLTVVDPVTRETVHQEELTLHPSVFKPFVDLNANLEDILGRFPPYEKPGLLAVFTHVYNDNELLRVWEAHYAKLVGYENLYVIDHGSHTSPRAVVHDKTTVVSIPRAAVDHRNISKFCAAFQRFLLQQYRWVMHVDSDEMVVHRQGPEALIAELQADHGAYIRRVHLAYEVVQDVDNEPALDLGVPVSTQRRYMKPAQGENYAKPVLASVPTTWGLGFHYALESHLIQDDANLWLFHCANIDAAIKVERNKAWALSQQTAAAQASTPQESRELTIETAQARIRAEFNAEIRPLEDWMVGTF